jgi:hypothetical protein
MRRSLAVLLAAVLSTGSARPGTDDQSGIPEKIRSITPNTPVEVRFHDGAKVRGWIRDVTGDGFALEHEVKHQLQRTDYRFDSVQSVKSVKNVHPSHTTRNILIGVAIAVVVIGAAFAAAVASTPIIGGD